jgi:hypothetical protein
MPSPGENRKTRTLAGLTQGIRPVFRFRGWFAPILVIALITLGLFVRGVMDRSIKSMVGDQLQTILDADVAAIEVWLENQAKIGSELARDSVVRSSITTLVGVGAVPGAAAAGELTADPAQAEVREYLNPIAESLDYMGFVAVDLLGRVVAATEDILLGYRLAADHPVWQYLRPVLDGRTVVSPPLPSLVELPDEQGRSTVGRPIMVVMAPILDSGDRVIGALGFRVAPENDFTRLLQVARIGNSGETYAFNRDGLMVSESRFDDELREIGLLPVNPDARGILNVHIRDPGGNMLEGYRPDVQYAELPLTRMAAAATAGRNGIDLDGYRDYRGVDVVGAWRWLPEHQIGITTEVDEVEAYAIMNGLRSIFWGLFALLTVISAVVLLGTFVIERLGKRAARATIRARQLGQYTLEEKIGEGGMGEVYRAHHAMLRRPTAVKLLRVDRASKTDIARFEREVRLTSRLTHPNTIAIFDYGRTADGVFYYAMELLPGVSLDRLVKTLGPLPPARVIHILRQVCESLAEAHGIGLIHRDIKPANIIVCERGGAFDVAKVLDFGIVKDLSGNGDQDLTRAGTFTGTPQYLSPEAIRTPGEVDARSDIYALGAVAYFLLTGRPVFEGLTVPEVCAKHLNDPPMPLSEAADQEIPEDLERVVLACLEKDPMSRPGTVTELYEELSACEDSGSWSREDARRWWEDNAELIDAIVARMSVDEGEHTFAVDSTRFGTATLQTTPGAEAPAREVHTPET